MKAYFRNKLWTVRYLRRDFEKLGETCFSDRTITINGTAKPKRLLAAEIDEAIHACFPDLDNDVVDEASDSISKFLWRRGYRRTK